MSKVHKHSASLVLSQSDYWVEINIFIEYNYCCIAEDAYRLKRVGHRAQSPPNKDLPDRQYRG